MTLSRSARRLSLLLIEVNTSFALIHRDKSLTGVNSRRSFSLFAPSPFSLARRFRRKGKKGERQKCKQTRTTAYRRRTTLRLYAMNILHDQTSGNDAPLKFIRKKRSIVGLVRRLSFPLVRKTKYSINISRVIICLN